MSGKGGERMKVEIKFEDGKFSFELIDLLESMTYEEKMKAIRHFSMEEDIRDEVVNQLSGENYDFWWGDDDDRRLKILSALEDELISRYKWSFIYEIRDYVEKCRDNRELYWKLYHSGEWGRKWLEQNHIRINYPYQSTTLRRFERLLKDTFSRLENRKEQPE